MPLIPALGKQRQSDLHDFAVSLLNIEFQASQGYKVRLSFKEEKENVES